MSYTPPGVTTTVKVANSIVQLPGGTRILSIIGLGQNTLSTAGESVLQPTGSHTSLPLINSANGVVSIQSIYDFSGPGGAQVVYSPAGKGQYGEGYFITPTGLNSGTSIAWAPSANPYPSSTTPTAASQYYVTYSGTFAGTGTQVYTVTVTQPSNYDAILPGTGTLTGLVIVGVSGLSGQVYTASGTHSGFDAYGYGIVDSGYVLSASGTLQWGAVPTGSYGYAYATTPLTGNSFFASYTYNKSGSNYAPQNFVDQNIVVQNYGPEANWIPVTGNNGQVSYKVGSLNPVTLASRLAFANGCSIVNIAQISGNGQTAGSFLNALNDLQGQTVDIIVPLTVGSGSSLNEVSTTNKIQTIQAVQAHCDTMSLPGNAMERVEIASIGQADIGNAATANSYLYAVETFDDERVMLVAPGACVVQIQDPTGNFQNVTVDSAFLACGVAGLSCNPLSDVATPLTRQQLVNYVGLNAVSPSHPSNFYLTIEKNILGGAGVCVIDTLGAQIYVRQQLTTNQANPAVGEFSVVTSTDYVSQAVRYTCNQFIGKKLIPALVVPAIKSTIVATMSALVQDQLISAPGAITVTPSPDDATTILATVQYVPVFPLNHIQVTFTISTQL